MKFGDVEGKEEMYDDSGNMLLQEGECISEVVNETCDGIFEKHSLGWRIVFMDGPGCYFITDTRTVFLREPLSYQGGEDELAKRLYSFTDGQYWPDRADKAKSAGAKEFFEIMHDEIEKFKHGKQDSSIFVDSEDGKYKVVVGRNVGDALEKIIKR
ncbi:MAG: hypothetical protein SVM80_01695 [Halobacteriota archaeon]|nr:hypothetical protein [Halobacteriota archaeon]